nr:hypothetical protein Iba_chr13dCG8690 [Ipomoea batatas]
MKSTLKLIAEGTKESQDHQGVHSSHLSAKKIVKSRSRAVVLRKGVASASLTDDCMHLRKQAGNGLPFEFGGLVFYI